MSGQFAKFGQIPILEAEGNYMIINGCGLPGGLREGEAGGEAVTASGHENNH